nr:transducin/WD40 repeat-like superfamily protein [Tanacetum cinerariifolium]
MARPQINYVIDIITPVSNQKEDNSCIKVVLADLTTIICRMNNSDSDPELDLTPHIMIDRDGTTHDCVEMFLTGQSYALLIVGVNTMSKAEDEHYRLVKNSYGEKWGDRGFSRVGFEVFQQLIYPFQQTPVELKVQADWEASKNTKGNEKQRGRSKQEEFMKKVKEMMVE